MSDSIPALPVEEVLAGLKIPALADGTTPDGLVAFVRVNEPDGGKGWCLRVTSNTDEDETLGVLVGYVEHLKREAASGWDDSDPTRAST